MDFAGKAMRAGAWRLGDYPPRRRGPGVESLSRVSRLRIALTRKTKTPWGDPHGVFEKSGGTYFRACGHYHRPEKLNDCVRNGDRCDLFSMFTRRRTPHGQARRP